MTRILFGVACVPLSLCCQFAVGQVTVSWDVLFVDGQEFVATDGALEPGRIISFPGPLVVNVAENGDAVFPVQAVPGSGRVSLVAARVNASGDVQLDPLLTPGLPPAGEALPPTSSVTDLGWRGVSSEGRVVYGAPLVDGQTRLEGLFAEDGVGDFTSFVLSENCASDGGDGPLLSTSFNSIDRFGFAFSCESLNGATNGVYSINTDLATPAFQFRGDVAGEATASSVNTSGLGAAFTVEVGGLAGDLERLYLLVPQPVLLDSRPISTSSFGTGDFLSMGRSSQTTNAAVLGRGVVSSETGTGSVSRLTIDGGLVESQLVVEPGSSLPTLSGGTYSVVDGSSQVAANDRGTLIAGQAVISDGSPQARAVLVFEREGSPAVVATARDLPSVIVGSVVRNISPAALNDCDEVVYLETSTPFVNDFAEFQATLALLSPDGSATPILTEGDEITANFDGITADVTVRSVGRVLPGFRDAAGLSNRMPLFVSSSDGRGSFWSNSGFVVVPVALEFSPGQIETAYLRGRVFPCLADFNGDRVFGDGFDLFDFLGALDQLDPRADVDGDGLFDTFDLFSFLAALDVGCTGPCYVDGRSP